MVKGVNMSTVKEEAKKLVDQLPEQATWDDLMYEIYVRKKIDTGIQAADEGKVVAHEDVKRMFAKE